MFRSDKMVFCEMYLQPEAAFSIMCRLGDIGLVQFSDMNEHLAPYERNYITEVCRCDEIERKLRYIEHEILKDNIIIWNPTEIPKSLHPSDTALFENLIDKWEADIMEITSNEAILKQDLLEMKEMHYVLHTIGPMLGDTNIGIESLLSKYKSGGGDIVLGGRLFVMCGVVKRSRCFPFQLMLWRVSHGNIYYRQAEYDEVLEDPYTGADIRKVSFLAFCQGEMLASRMEKVFSGFKVNVYPCPDTPEERLNLLSRVEVRIVDLEEVLHKAKNYRCRSLRLISKEWKGYMIRTRKAKAIYNTLNHFTIDVTKNCLIGHCWMPEKDLKIVKDILKHVSEKVESNVPSFIIIIQTDIEPPTVQRTNKFTYGFQVLINAYGDSKYGELNPGLYTVITFPFLFAIMFGDMGHSVIMISFAVWMLINESLFLKQYGSEIWNIFFGGRYVILMLGIFSVITGFIYNDVFSKSFNLGQSMWANIDNQKNIETQVFIDFSGKNRLYKPYPYGLDPIWKMSSNHIMVDNSMKMKMSLIVGVIHMLFGIVLSLFNHIHFKKYYSIVLQFIPEFTFLLCIFFWLVFLIFFKWMHFYDSHDKMEYGSSCAPQILILFIDMVLYSSTEKKKPDAGCKVYLFESQQLIQTILVTIGLVMVPILLFGSPFYVTWHNKKMKKQIMIEYTEFRKYQRKDEPDTLLSKLAKYDAAFGELMIHQAVYTIEFVLSTISHTASYLRLWALSLAHAQLSEMLWNMVLVIGVRTHKYPNGVISTFIVFPIWAAFTVAILVVMEGLSAFLHTLRLHWLVLRPKKVEFMSKFFIGGGYPFKPFSFKALLITDIRAEGICTTKARKRGKKTKDVTV